MTLIDLILNEHHGVIELDYGSDRTLEDKVDNIKNKAKYSGMLGLIAVLEKHYPELYVQVKYIDAEYVLDVLKLPIKAYTGDTQRL